MSFNHLLNKNYVIDNLFIKTKILKKRNYLTAMKKTLLKNSQYNFNLSKADLENIFSINSDKNGNIVFNLNETLYIQSTHNNKVMLVSHPIHWSTLSYNLYGTPRLAWILLKLNNVPMSQMFNKIDTKFPVIYLSKDDVVTIINQINE